MSSSSRKCTYRPVARGQPRLRTTLGLPHVGWGFFTYEIRSTEKHSTTCCAEPSALSSITKISVVTPGCAMTLAIHSRNWSTRRKVGMTTEKSTATLIARQWMDQPGTMTKGRWACVIVLQRSQCSLQCVHRNQIPHGGRSSALLLRSMRSLLRAKTAQPSSSRFDQRRKATDVFQFSDFRGGKFHFEGLFHGHHQADVGEAIPPIDVLRR